MVGSVEAVPIEKNTNVLKQETACPQLKEEVVDDAHDS